MRDKPQVWVFACLSWWGNEWSGNEILKGFLWETALLTRLENASTPTDICCNLGGTRVMMTSVSSRLASASTVNPWSLERTDPPRDFSFSPDSLFSCRLRICWGQLHQSVKSCNTGYVGHHTSRPLDLNLAWRSVPTEAWSLVGYLARNKLGYPTAATNVNFARLGVVKSLRLF